MAVSKCNTRKHPFSGQLIGLISGWTWKCFSFSVLLNSLEKRNNRNNIWRGGGNGARILGMQHRFSFLLCWSAHAVQPFRVGFSQMAVPRPISTLPLLSLIFILHGFSPLIHPCQATIPYKANGSPHLASYFHIRSAVTDRVYTGSGLECKPACLCHRPDCALQTCPHLLPPPAVLAVSPPVTIISLHFSLLILSSSSHLSSIVPPFLPPALTSPVSLHRLFQAGRSPNTCTHAHMDTCTHLAGGGTSGELALRFGTGGWCVLMVHSSYSQTRDAASERKTKGRRLMQNTHIQTGREPRTSFPFIIIPTFCLPLPLRPFFARGACSSLRFHVSTGSLPLICKVLTFLCVHVCGFICCHGESVPDYMHSPAFPLLPHLGLAWHQNLYSEFIQALIVLKGWQTRRSFWLRFFFLPLSPVFRLHFHISPHSSTFPFIPPCSPRVWHKWWAIGKRGDLISYNSYLLGAMVSSLTQVSLLVLLLKRDTWPPKSPTGKWQVRPLFPPSAS